MPGLGVKPDAEAAAIQAMTREAAPSAAGRALDCGRSRVRQLQRDQVGGCGSTHGVRLSESPGQVAEPEPLAELRAAQRRIDRRAV